MQIAAWVDERNRMTERMRTRGGRERCQNELEEVRGGVREARREMKNRLRRLDRQRWEEKIERCEEASRSGNFGEMHKILRELGAMNNRATEGHNILRRSLTFSGGISR